MRIILKTTKKQIVLIWGVLEGQEIEERIRLVSKRIITKKGYPYGNGRYFTKNDREQYQDYVRLINMKNKFLKFT